MGMMTENPNRNKGIESGRDAQEPEKKGKDQIWAQCLRTRFKRKGSNQDVMSKNPNQKEGIESKHDAGEPEIKKEGFKYRCNARELE